MEMKPIKSSNIESVGYDEPTRTLAVKFKSGPDTFHYKDVSPERHHAMITSDSVGSHFHQHVRGKHAFEKAGAKGIPETDE